MPRYTNIKRYQSCRFNHVLRYATKVNQFEKPEKSWPYLQKKLKSRRHPKKNYKSSQNTKQFLYSLTPKNFDSRYFTKISFIFAEKRRKKKQTLALVLFLVVAFYCFIVFGRKIIMIKFGKLLTKRQQTKNCSY